MSKAAPKNPSAKSGRKPARDPRRDFARKVAETPASGETLPLTHLTDGFHLRDIDKGGSLEPTYCGVFEEPLLYLFYGRPAYRVAASADSSGLEHYWPVCFVMRNASAAPHRIYPFDSGAFDQGRYDAHRHRNMIKEDFELEADPSTPGRLLKLFWPDSRSYFNNRGALTPQCDGLDFEVKTYSQIIGTKGNAPFDERHSAIEIQSKEAIALKDNVIAVIMPAEFASPAICARFESMGAKVLPFDTVDRHGPGDMVGQIYQICRDLYSGEHGTPACW